MAALTTRLSLYKPGGGSTGLILPDETADIDKINGNMDLIDAAIGAKNVTSTTRPATPYDGQVIYETDTRNTMVYRATGTLWAPVGIPNAASSAFRDAMFSAPTAGASVIRTDRAGKQETYNGTAWAMADGTIYPASFAVFTGGTIPTQDPDGWININGSTALSFNDIFTDAFRDYEIIFDDASTAAAQQTTWRLRAAGADDATANYHYEFQFSNAASVASLNLVSQTNAQLTAGAAVLSFGGTLTLRGPKLVRYTRFQHHNYGALSSTAEGIFIAGGRHNPSTAYDGISFSIPAALTGKFKIKGI